MRETYNYSSVARDYRRDEYYEENQRRASNHRAQAKHRIDPKGLLIVVMAFAILGYLMVNYVRMQSTLTSSIRSVAAKQVELNKLQTENDEKYSRAVCSTSIEEIENIARGELGMNYAQEGQIIVYSSAANDYMRRVDYGN